MGVTGAARIPKTVGQRLLELVQSLLVLRDAIAGANNGGPHNLIPIYGQLRALLIEKRRSNKPLLIDIARIVGQPLAIWCSGPPTSDYTAFPALVLCISGFPVSLHQQDEGQIKLDIGQFLKHPIVYHRGREYTVAEIIVFFANQAGGAHYATHVTKEFAEILALRLGQEAALCNFLVQIAEVIYELGIRLIKRLNDFAVHLVAYIPAQIISGEKYIFDTKYPDSLVRATIGMVAPHTLFFQITGIDGKAIQVRTTRLLDLAKPHYFLFSYEADKNLHSVIDIRVDGELFGAFRVPYPVLFINELTSQETYHNRSAVDESGGGIRMAWAMLGISDAEAGFIDRCHTIFSCSKLVDEERDWVVYLEQVWGYSKPGATNVELNRPIFKSPISRLMGGDWTAPP